MSRVTNIKKKYSVWTFRLFFMNDGLFCYYYVKQQKKKQNKNIEKMLK